MPLRVLVVRAASLVLFLSIRYNPFQIIFCAQWLPRDGIGFFPRVQMRIGLLSNLLV